MKSENWGGKRSGSGKKSSWKSPGMTKSIRVPVVLHEEVMRYARELDEAKSGGKLEIDTESREGEEIRGEIVAAVNIKEVIEVLSEALKLKANSGGKIKAEIRKALKLLETFSLFLEIL